MIDSSLLNRAKSHESLHGEKPNLSGQLFEPLGVSFSLYSVKRLPTPWVLHRFNQEGTDDDETEFANGQ